MSDITPVEIENIEALPETTPVETREGSSEARSDRGGDRRNDRPRRDRKDGSRDEPKEFAEELLGLDRVTRVTAGGRQLRFRASIVIGDGKGRVGLGLGKSGEVQGAIEKAVRDAKKNLISFPMVNGTIPHDVSMSFKSSSIFLHPAHMGTGIIAGGAVRKVLAVSGLKDIIAKQHGAPNKITNARVVILALQALKPLEMMKAFPKKKGSTGAEVTKKVETVAETPKKEEAAKAEVKETKKVSPKTDTPKKSVAKTAAPKKSTAKKETK